MANCFGTTCDICVCWETATFNSNVTWDWWRLASVAMRPDKLGLKITETMTTGCEVETVDVALCLSQCSYLRMIATIICCFCLCMSISGFIVYFRCSLLECLSRSLIIQLTRGHTCDLRESLIGSGTEKESRSSSSVELHQRDLSSVWPTSRSLVHSNRHDRCIYQ